MANENRIRQRQVTKSKQLQRALGRLLEMDSNELADEVKNELDRNPALEVAVDENEQNTRNEDGRKSETSDQIQRNDYAEEDDIPPMFDMRPRGSAGGEQTYVPEIVSEISLTAYLMEQVGERDLTDKERLIASNIVGNLDSNGYLLRNARSIADDITFNEGVDCETDEVEQVLKMVQQLDPPGVAAANLRECLMLQLRRKPGADARMALRVVDEGFDNFAKKRYDALAAMLGVDRDTLARVLKNEILSLNPKPGSAYSGGRSEEHQLQITPDFLVEVDGDQLSVTLNSKIPELNISATYQRQVESYEQLPPATKSRQDEMRIVRDHYDRARSYLNLLKMRQSTLFECMREICRRQREFFFTGNLSDLKPMTLQNIADAVGRDVSVISRAMANKYVDTPWGIKSLRFFFSEGVDGVSTTEIKDALRQLVDAEDKRQPCTDSQLAALLAERGYNISRRTVTKYRMQLSIPTAQHRTHVH